MPCASFNGWKNSVRHNMSYRVTVQRQTEEAKAESGQANTRPSNARSRKITNTKTKSKQNERKLSRFRQLVNHVQENGQKGGHWIIDDRDDDDMRKLRKPINDAFEEIRIQRAQGRLRLQ